MTQYVSPSAVLLKFRCSISPGLTRRTLRLARHFPAIPVSLEDERFTSVLAHRAMIDGGMKKSERRKKESVDKISAAIILQSYIDRNKA